MQFGFVPNGRLQSIQGNWKWIKEQSQKHWEEIEQKYATEKQRSGFLTRFWLRRRMRVEFRLRIEEVVESVAPRDGLY